jgi:hypothetical protein
LEVLHKLQPKADDIAVLLNPNLATAASQSEDVRRSPKTLIPPTGRRLDSTPSGAPPRLRLPLMALPIAQPTISA